MISISKQKILLSISILISNRPDTVERCLKSLEDLRKGVASELILVDTGCGEQVRRIIEPYGDKIVDFAWCNDFAAARNAGLEKARGEWFMYIDDDEWLEDASAIIDFFNSGTYKKYKSANYTVRSYMDPEGSTWVDTLHGRLFPLEKDTRFVGKVHEMVPIEAPVCVLPCFAHHSGYVFRNAEEKKKHIERNKALLLEEYRQDRGNHRTAAHLIQEYEGDGEFTESLKVIQESCEITTYKGDGRFWHFLKLHEMLDYACLKAFDKVYEAGLAYLQGKRQLMGAQVGVNSLMMEVCDKLGRTEECMHYLERYLELAGEIAKREDITALTVLDMSQFWSEANKKKAYARGVSVAYRLGDFEKTAYYIHKIDWQEKELQILDGTLESVLLYFSKVPFEPWMTEVMDTILKRGFSWGNIGGVLADMSSDSGERRRLLQVLASCENTDAQVSLWRAEYAVLNEDTDLLCRVLEELVRSPEGNLLLLEEQVLQYMCRTGISGREYVEKVPLWRWHIFVAQWSDTKALEIKRREHTLWKGMMPAEPLYLWDMEAALRERETRTDIESGRDFQALYQSFLMTAEKFHQVYSRIYHPDAFGKEELFTVLPPDAQFAEKYLLAAKCLEKGDERGFVSLVKEAGICSPAMGEACKQLLEKYRNERDRESREAQAELDVLIQMLKQRADQLCESGQRDEAADIIKQILQIRPDEKLAEKYHITE